MRKVALCLAFACLLVPAMPVRADDCAGAQTTLDMNTCILEAMVALQSQLDALYQKRMTQAQDNPETRKILIRSQKAYEAYSKAECERQSHMYDGGTFARVAAGMCLKSMMADRIDALKVWPTPED